MTGYEANFNLIGWRSFVYFFGIKNSFVAFEREDWMDEKPALSPAIPASST